LIKAITSNLQWKALALVIAVVLWSAVVGEPELMTSQSAPVLYKNLPRDLQIASDVPDRVHLEIRGASGRLTPQQLAETAVVVDLSAVGSPVERTFTITGDSVTLPPGVKLLRAVPSQLRLRFERALSKEVPVQVRAGKPPAGYRLASEQVSPAKLRVTGPESRVQALESAQTDPIDLGAVVGPAEFRVHAYVTDPQVRFESSPIVTVRINVTKVGAERR
jgi:YbbR domain-containing protein